MIIADTSVWIDFFRGRDTRTVQIVKDLLDQDQIAITIPIRIEILSGALKKQYPLLRRVLSALPVFYPTQETWSQIEKWIEWGLAMGERFGSMDLLIAAIAAEKGATLFSLDDDFRRMAKLGWIKLFEW